MEYVDHPSAPSISAGLIILFALVVHYGAVLRKQLIMGFDAQVRADALVEQLSALRHQLLEKNLDLSDANSALKKALERVKELASRDPLTGAYNRRVMVEQLERQVVYKQRHCTASSVIMIDLDHFKDINDMHGHAIGDQALKSVVDTVQKELRDGDVLARIGGEEFLVLLPQADREAGRQTAERLRAAVSAIVLLRAARRVPLRASFGVAELIPGEDADAWLRRADLALYLAKEAGRDRVVLAG